MPTNEKGSRSTVRSVLNHKEMFVLDEYVVKHYTESGTNNAEFAEIMNLDEVRGKFRFDLNAAHIASAIAARDIPNNRAHKRAASVCDGTAMARLSVLEEEHGKLRDFVKRLSTSLGFK